MNFLLITDCCYKMFILLQIYKFYLGLKTVLAACGKNETVPASGAFTEKLCSFITANPTLEITIIKLHRYLL